MSDKEIPQDLAKRMANWIRGATHIPHICRYAAFKEIIRDLDALSAPKDPAEVAVEQMIGAYLCSPTEDDRVKATGMIRAAYADHFKQDAEREEAVKELSDEVRRCAPTMRCLTKRNKEVRRLYGWDHDGR